MSLNLATILAESAKTHPHKPAIVLGDVSLPYAMLDGFARRFAGALRGLGVKPGQHIALMLPNVPHFTIAYFGGHYAACPIVPMNVLPSGGVMAAPSAPREASRPPSVLMTSPPPHPTKIPREERAAASTRAWEMRIPRE